MTGLPLIVGLGSPHGDDQAGWCVIDALLDCGISTDQARAARTPAELWDWCDRHRSLTICDAGVDCGLAGSTHCWSWPEQSLPLSRGGTHDLALGDVLTLGQMLGMSPERVTIWTITGTAFLPHSPPAEAVVNAATGLAVRLAEGLRHA